MSDKGFRLEIPVHIKRDRRARKVLAHGDMPKGDDSVSRIARLLALAHKWEGMVRRGEVEDYVEIAERSRLTRGRVTQICNLVLLAPTLQEAILEPDKAPLLARETRRLAGLVAWHGQRENYERSSGRLT